uniref:Uncharacterized protein n=1 Tax=Tanacetum cinerariifolium TaxID=118510 RepID=A0A699GUR8_TANCI|nr:hypothetical protein [Tanacetum cinerariifolium]
MVSSHASDNVLSTVTYTSISFDSDRPSWGIPLMDADELPKMDLYDEVTQQGQEPLLSHAYVPDPMELDEHVPVYASEPKHLEYHVASDDDIQSMEEDSIEYPDEPEDNDGNPEEDPEEDHTDYPTDGGDGDDEPSDDDDDDDDTDDEDEEPTEDEDDDDEEEDHLSSTDSSALPVIDIVPSAEDIKAFETDEARKTVRLEPSMSASIEARIAEHVVAPIPPTSPAYDQAPLGYRAAMIRMRDDILEENMPPRRKFIQTAPPPSPSHDAWTIARAADRVEDVGYVRALQASEHKMMTFIEETNLRISYQAHVRRQEMRGQMTAYKTELHEVRHAYLSSKARNRALLARLENLETHMSRIEWQRQSAEDLTIRQMMRIHVLEARARIDTVEDTGSSC